VSSILTITARADSLQLLTIGEMRSAIGTTGSEHDVELTQWGLKIAADICSECNIAIGAGAPPTLLRETLTEVFRSVRSEVLMLSRRHEVTVSGITEDGTALAPSDYEVDPESGLVHRLSSDNRVAWRASKITVVYAAGFASNSIPRDLAHAASDFLRQVWRESDRDPLVKSERVRIDDIEEIERQFWIGSVPGQSNEGAVPDVVAGQLLRFRNYRL